LEGDTSHGYGAVCSAIVVAGLLAAVLARVLGHHDVEMQTIAGALCAYLLIGTLFSNIFAAMDLLGPSNIFNHSMAYPDYAYFSFTTLTTTGYGDYTIVTNFGRRVAMLEAVVGPVFLATTVSRLVASARRRDRGESTPVEGA
ncbi:MAG TPA: potassium channel family protein, partial [Microthrixaceae bacterium]|nr:potassium channel family protein [Microthrixaceae bacterium]